MNRIRKSNNIYQVLITPHIRISPDSSIILGNWTDINLRDCHILEFKSLQEAQAEAFNYPDIDWYRIVMNHKYVFERIKTVVGNILEKHTVQIINKLTNPTEFKNKVFDRVDKQARILDFEDKGFLNDIISITIINPYNTQLNEISKLIMMHSNHLWRNDLRIKDRIDKDNEIIILGKTELGTTYTIKLITSLYHQFKKWYELEGHFMDDQFVDGKYNQMKKQQRMIDRYSFE